MGVLCVWFVYLFIRLGWLGDYVNIIVLYLYVLCVYIIEGYFILVLIGVCMVEFKGGEIMF